MTSDYIQADYTISSNGLPNILNKKCDKFIPRELAFKTITDNVDSNKKLLKKRNHQLNNQHQFNEIFAINDNQRNVNSCTSKLEHHRGGVDKKIKEKYNMRIRNSRVEGT